MWLGAGLDTASGVAHEIDIVARSPTVTAILEAKNLGDMPGKNDIIVFFAKVIDYLIANPELVLKDICLTFMSRNSFEPRAMAACLGLGIHPVASDIRPFPVLVNNAMLMQDKLQKGLVLPYDAQSRLDDLYAQLNTLGLALDETWPDNRFGYQSEDSLTVKAIVPRQADALAEQLRQANSDCLDLIAAFRSAETNNRGG